MATQSSSLSMLATGGGGDGPGWQLTAAVAAMAEAHLIGRQCGYGCPDGGSGGGGVGGVLGGGSG